MAGEPVPQGRPWRELLAERESGRDQRGRERYFSHLFEQLGMGMKIVGA